MKARFLILISLACALALSAASCSFLANAPVTDAQVKKFATSMRELQKMGPEMKEFAGGGIPSQGDADYKKFEDLIKKSGFKDLEEFMYVNMKVLWAYGLIQANKGLAEMDKLARQDNSAELRKLLEDPNIPEASKAEARKALEKARTEYLKNKDWAEFAAKTAQGQTERQTLDAVMSNYDLIELALQGK